ncbi:MAG: hypothetical protein F9K46_07440 [Anaerolineae bacterium]|nr:MAG: hypothetical protein F9K46_07440 [Anaerolineae bacterium]
MADLNKPTQTSNPLSYIRKGMSVYDLSEKQIGVVEMVYMGGASDEAIQMGGPAATSPDVDLSRNGSFIENLAHVFDDSDNVPQEIKERLLRDGYVRVNIKGLLGLTRFVFPDQIAYVSDEGLVLNAYEDELLRI